MKLLALPVFVLLICHSAFAQRVKGGGGGGAGGGDYGSIAPSRFPKGYKLPDDPARSILDGLKSFELGNVDDANLSFDGALVVYSNRNDLSGEITANLINGLLFSSFGLEHEADKYFTEAVRLGPFDPNHFAEAFALRKSAETQAEIWGAITADIAYNGVEQKLGESDTVALGTLLDDRGDANARCGQFQVALTKFRKALALQQDSQDLAGQAASYSGMAMTYAFMGDKQNALRMASASADANKKAIASLTTRLNGMSDDSQSVNFSDLIDHASVISQIYDSYARTSQDSISQGLAYEQSGGDKQAMDCYRSAQTNAQQYGNVRTYCLAFARMGHLAAISESKNNALDYLRTALCFGEQSGLFDASRYALMDVARLLAKDNLEVAINFAAACVEMSEQQQGGTGNYSNSSIRLQLADSRLPDYEYLADLLARDNRVVQAQNVLAMAKFEAFGTMQRGVPRTPAEKRWYDAYIHFSEANTHADTNPSDYQHIQKRINLRDREKPSTSDSREKIRQDFNDFLEHAMSEDIQPESDDAINRRSVATDGIKAAFSQIPVDVSAVYVLTDSDQVDLIVARAEGANVFHVPAKDIKSKLEAFKTALRDPTIDPRPLGKDIYDTIVKPIEDQLNPKGVTLWYLAGPFKGIPVNALWDGSKFLVEKYPSSYFKPEVLTYPRFTDRFVLPPRQNAPAFVYGETRERAVKDPITGDEIDFPALPGAGEEAKAIASILGTTPVMNGNFTIKGVSRDLASKPGILHFSTHFNHVESDDRRSFLLTGVGLWTLEILKGWPQDAFENIDLATLSACGTADGESMDGGEAESFSDWFIRRGAHAVVATLWPIQDDSTEHFMTDFYSSYRASPDTGKLSALRQAQLDMITGKTVGDPAAKTRSVNAIASSSDYDFTPWPTGLPKYAHPYYWAPFVLYGNVR